MKRIWGCLLRGVCSIVMILMLVCGISIVQQPAAAHPFSVAYSTITFTPEETQLIFSIDDLSLIESVELIDHNVNNELEQAELDEHADRIIQWVKAQLSLSMDGTEIPWNLKSLELELIGERRMVTFKATYPAFAPGQTVTFTDGHYYDGKVHSAYVNFLSVQYGDMQSATVLQGKNRNWTMVLEEHEQFYAEPGTVVDPAIPATSSTSWWAFFRLGTDHILFGFDHLLFLLALLLARQTFKQYVGIITSFTIAHSLTLTLASIGWVSIPGVIIEPLIALSICYVAAENLFRKQVKNRWLLTFFFGLVHGIGFADIMVEMNVPKKNMLISLLGFNLGIEAIQLILVALALPVLYLLRRYIPSKHLFTVLSSITIVIGAIWFIERLL